MKIRREQAEQESGQIRNFDQPGSVVGASKSFLGLVAGTCEL